MRPQTVRVSLIGASVLVGLWIMYRRSANAKVIPLALLGRLETHVPFNRPLSTTGAGPIASGSRVSLSNATLGPSPYQPPNGAPVPTPALPSATVRLAQYNAHTTTTVQQTQTALDRLMGQTDVIGINEWSPKFKPLFGWAQLKGWSHFIGHGSTPIFWRTDKYNKLESGSVKLNEMQMIESKSTGKLTRKWVPRYANYVRLQDRNTGQTFYEVSAHLISSVERGGKANKNAPHRVAVYREQIAALAKLTRNLSAKDKVFVTGDFNIDSRSRTGLLAPLRAAHLRNNWDWLGTDQFGTGTFGRRFIDYIWSFSNSPFGSVQIVSNKQVENLPSDHDAVISTYRLI